MPIEVLNVLFPSAFIIVTMPTSVLWIGFWWAPTSAIPQWISVRIVCLSVRSNRQRRQESAVVLFYRRVDEQMLRSYNICKVIDQGERYG